MHLEVQGASTISTCAADIGPWMGLTKRLGAADWFTAKVSAAGVVAPVFALCTAKGRTGKMMKSMDEDAATSSSSTYYDQQLELLSLYKDLCSDDTPMVRRAAAKHLGSILAAAGWSHRDFCAATLPALCHDEQDSVRQLAVAALANAGKSFGKHPQWTCQFWMPIVKDGSTDMSWYVLTVIISYIYSIGRAYACNSTRQLLRWRSN